MSPLTQRAYVDHASRFARHFGRSPARLGPDEIRQYLVYLTTEKQLAPSSIIITVAALRFLYRVTLPQPWSIEAVIPAPKQPQTIPVVLSPAEVVEFLDHVTLPKHRAILTTCYAGLGGTIQLTAPRNASAGLRSDDTGIGLARMLAWLEPSLRAQASGAATGTLVTTNSDVILLTGTYAAGVFNVTGGGYTITATVTGGVIAGTGTAPGALRQAVWQPLSRPRHLLPPRRLSQGTRRGPTGGRSASTRS